MQNYKRLVLTVSVLSYAPLLLGFGICDEGKLSPSLTTIYCIYQRTCSWIAKTFIFSTFKKTVFQVWAAGCGGGLVQEQTAPGILHRLAATSLDGRGKNLIHDIRLD